MDPKRKPDLTPEDVKRIERAEASGYKQHHEKGDPDVLEWWSPEGRFCLFEDLPQ
jgi:hypothetical protein